MEKEGGGGEREERNNGVPVTAVCVRRKSHEKVPPLPEPSQSLSVSQGQFSFLHICN